MTLRRRLDRLEARTRPASPLAALRPIVTPSPFGPVMDSILRLTGELWRHPTLEPGKVPRGLPGAARARPREWHAPCARGRGPAPRGAATWRSSGASPAARSGQEPAAIRGRHWFRRVPSQAASGWRTTWATVFDLSLAYIGLGPISGGHRVPRTTPECLQSRAMWPCCTNRVRGGARLASDGPVLGPL
jgi:hypothetical protein